MSCPTSLFKFLTLLFTSDRLGRTSAQLHQAIIAAIPIPVTHRHDKSLLPDILYSLTTWKSWPSFFTEMAYKWCSVVCERRPDLKGENCRGRELLFLSLEIRFHDFDFPEQGTGSLAMYAKLLTRTEHHRRMVDLVFESGEDEMIADFRHSQISSCSRWDHSAHVRATSSIFHARRHFPQGCAAFSYSPSCSSVTQDSSKLGARIFLSYWITFVSRTRVLAAWGGRISSWTSFNPLETFVVYPTCTGSCWRSLLS